MGVVLKQENRARTATPRPTLRSGPGPDTTSQSAVRRSAPRRILRLAIGVGLIGLPTWFLMPSHSKLFESSETIAFEQIRDRAQRSVS
jgi:hypothetical protein